MQQSTSKERNNEDLANDTGVTGSGSEGSAAGGVSGSDVKDGGTTSGAVPSWAEGPLTGGGSTLSEGMATGTKVGSNAAENDEDSE